MIVFRDMEKLSLLEKESLEILKQLEHRCEVVELIESRKIKKTPWAGSLSVKYNDIDFSVLKKRMNIHAVELYLQENSLDFCLTDNFEFDDHKYLDSSNDPMAIYSQIAEIYGNNLQEIKTKIKKIINELNSEKTEKEIINITYNINIGKLVFNNKAEDFILLEGKQLDLTACLVLRGKYIRTGLGDIYDYIKPIPERYEDFKKNKKELKTFSDVIRGVANEINKKTNQYLSDKKLIDYKNNEYWIEHEIHKDI